MQTIILSVPSGSHSRALLKPLRHFFKQAITEGKIKLVIVSPMSEHPELTEEFSGSGFTFVPWQEKIFAEHKPDLLVTTTTGLDDFDLPILQAAKKCKTKILTYVESWDNIWKMEKKKEKMIKADTLLVWNKMMREHAIKALGYQKDQIHLVGSPRLDYFYDQDKIPSREKLFQYLGVDPGKKLVHIATVELYDISYIVKILSCARDSGKIKIPIEIYCSVHPGGDIKKHENYAKKYNVKLRYSFGRNDRVPDPDFRYNPTEEEMCLLASLWIHSDLMINFSSTAAIESMLGDTPTINVMFGKPFDFIAWRKSAVYRDFKEHYKDIITERGTRVVKNKKQLLSAVNFYLARPEADREARSKTCQKMITFLDGKCSERVFNHILEKIKNTP